ncbi:MAG: TIGR03936 family radical SAM-associated protein [Phycisphaerae bacterium]
MGQDPTSEEVNQHERCRWAFRFSIDGDLRFISHHDTIRMFKRALARAGLPVRYSEGFNPQPKIVIPLPRPVGVASDDEQVVVDFDELIDEDQAFSALAEQMPDQVKLKQATQLELKQSLQPDTVDYEFRPDQVWPDDVPTRVAAILEAESLPTQRRSPKHPKPRDIDLRPYLLDMKADEEAIHFTLQVTGSGAAKPSEIAGLLGFDAKFVNHCMRRLRVTWK